MKRIMVNSVGFEKKVKVGFSWTVFLFGALVPLVRGDFKNFFKMVIFTVPTFGLYYLYMCFKYNEKYIETLMEKGFKFK